MGIKKGQLVDIKIESLAFGGRGLAKIDGMAVFVADALPGDTARIQILSKKKGYAEARVIDVLEPSALRVKPLCPHTQFCGGCTWQSLEYDQQLAYKREHVVESLEHIGKLKDIKVNDTIPSEKQFGYRNKMEFTFSDRRWLPPAEIAALHADAQEGKVAVANQDFALGLHVPGTFNKVLDMDACLLQPDGGNEILKTVREHVKESGVPCYGLKSHEGFWRFLMLRHSQAYDSWMVNIVTSQEQAAWVSPLVDRLRQTGAHIVSIMNNVNGRCASIATGERETLLFGAPTLRERIGKYEFQISANSFFQTNTKSAELLYNVVKEFAQLTGVERVLDLYTGAGTIPIFLSGHAREVLGIEISESAVKDAWINCDINGTRNCTFICGDIKNNLTKIDNPPDVVILDPPRAGVHPDAIRRIRDMSPARIVYVSCNPATLARDLAELAHDYSVEEVQPVDMFPNTYHIECVARLERLHTRGEII